MADPNKKDESDIFIAQSVYPEAVPIFSFQVKSLEEIKDDCYIVLDTNVLLAPYIIGKEDPGKDDLLGVCQRIYKSLIEKGCLILPGQVVREFANRRVDKIAELYQQLSDKKAKILRIAKGKYPLLNSLSEYQEVEHLENEINKKIREYQDAVDKVLAHIQNWQLNDPVRSLYSQLFDESVVFDPQFDKEEIKKDLKRRQIHHIPPGYKDAGKGDSGVGDLLIWYTILELGKVHKKSVIFVSGDEKPDWFKQSQNIALHLRYELIDEFRRKSEGQAFHVVKFSQFLKLFGASERVVEEVQQEEKKLTHIGNAEELVGHFTLSWAYRAVWLWLEAIYHDFTLINYRGREIDFLLEEPNGIRTGIKVIARSSIDTIKERIEEFFPLINSRFDDFIINKFRLINITMSESLANEVSSYIKYEMSIPQNASIVVGYVNHAGEFVMVSNIRETPNFEGIIFQ